MANKLYKIGEEDATLPTLPLLIMYDGTVFEAKDAEDAVSVVLGESYLDLSDDDKWIERVQRARLEVLMEIGREQKLQVMDSRLGVIKLDYASDESDSQYQELEELKDKEKINIWIDNDKVYLLSLIKIGILVILENETSNILKPQSAPKDKSNKFIPLHQTYKLEDLIKLHL